MMKLIDTTCAHCGAQLTIDPDRKTAFCEFCGARLIIDNPAQSLNIDNAENMGYQFEKGRQRAQNEAIAQSAIHTEPYQPAAKKKHIFWWVMGWIFIFPIPATILTARSKNLKAGMKALIITAVWLIYFLLGVIARNS